MKLYIDHYTYNFIYNFLGKFASNIDSNYFKKKKITWFYEI